jgi:hypothetical protein
MAEGLVRLGRACLAVWAVPGSVMERGTRPKGRELLDG